MARCAGQIHGDSDIAGVGVIIYIHSSGLFTGGNWILTTYKLQIKITSAVFINAALTFVVSTFFWIYIYIHLRKDHLGVSRPLPDWVQVMKSAMVMQGDILLIAALAIIVTSLLRIKLDLEIPFYHTFIARSLVDMALTGHATAIVHVYPTHHNWGSRLVLLAATMLLWQWWTCLVLQILRNSKLRVNSCFENTNGLPGEYSTWVWLSMWFTPIGYIVLYLNLLDNGRHLAHRFEEILLAGPSFIRKTFSIRFKTLGCSSSVAEFIDALRNVAISIAFTVVIVISWTFALLLPASRLLNPLQSLISFVWNVLNVSALHAANLNMLLENPEKLNVSFRLVEDPETRWGFGQTFPFLMLLFPILAAADFCNGMRYTSCPEGFQYHAFIIMV